jgi:hypothetical protein
MARGGGDAGQSGSGRRPGGQTRGLEVNGDSVNWFVGFTEEGAHRGSSSMTVREGGGQPPAAGRRGGGGRRLEDR